MATVGSGKYTYEVIQDWARLPAGMSFGNVSSVATDSQDRVYAYHRAEPPVVVFDRDGNYLSAWGYAEYANPHGILIEGEKIFCSFITAKDCRGTVQSNHIDSYYNSCVLLLHIWWNSFRDLDNHSQWSWKIS